MCPHQTQHLRFDASFMHILFVDYQWYDITLNIMHFSKPDRIGFLFFHWFCFMFPFKIHRVLVVNNTEAICNCQRNNSGINNQKTIKHQIANHYAYIFLFLSTVGFPWRKFWQPFPPQNRYGGWSSIICKRIDPPIKCICPSCFHYFRNTGSHFHNFSVVKILFLCVTLMTLIFFSVS